MQDLEDVSYNKQVVKRSSNHHLPEVKSNQNKEESNSILKLSQKEPLGSSILENESRKDLRIKIDAWDTTSDKNKQSQPFIASENTN